MSVGILLLQRAIPAGAFDTVMVTVNFLLQTAVTSVLPLCAEHNRVKQQHFRFAGIVKYRRILQT